MSFLCCGKGFFAWTTGWYRRSAKSHHDGTEAKEVNTGKRGVAAPKNDPLTLEKRSEAPRLQLGVCARLPCAVCRVQTETYLLVKFGAKQQDHLSLLY